ncbi:MAG TPA: mannose-6-phosphate isomerase [Streptosporangiaceae bacterium]|nr:mannose-6-phosphate isomerase [Streptosporangiaceae bacterium]
MFVLGPNQLRRFYQGGAEIAGFRGTGGAQDGPEDWVASTTVAFGEQQAGLSRLPDGRMLADAIGQQPAWFLGPEHVAAYGTDTGLLVKLLDAGQRLPVHCHPDQRYSRANLGGQHGKTEAWIVLRTSGPDTCVYLGFREEIPATVLARWVATQDVAALVGALHKVPVAPGHSVLVPAGTPHAIGPGVFLAELQEPTDLSILLEWRGFLDDAADAGSLGLGYPRALAAVDRAGWSPARLAGLHRAPAPPGAGAGITRLLPPAADPFFQAELLQAGPLRAGVEPGVPAGYAVWVVFSGTGTLVTEHGGTLPVRRGMTVLVPYADGAARLSGDVQVIRCLPPRPVTA